jgi:hypothetical protein
MAKHKKIQKKNQTSDQKKKIQPKRDGNGSRLPATSSPSG